MKAAQQMYSIFRRRFFPRFASGCCMGSLKTDEKEAVMEQFRRGDVKILVSTTVIEVGVDVPNATVMVIEQAERFGLAQLHQLRGRVGRGAEQSYCILVTGKLNDAGARAHPHHGGFERRILHRRNGFEAARPRASFSEPSNPDCRRCGSPTSFAIRTCSKSRAAKRRRSSRIRRRRTNCGAP